MKKIRSNILVAWVLMICFIAGQYIVYTHQHKIIASTSTKLKGDGHRTTHSTLQEKCSICDAMHHINALVVHYTYFSPNIVTKHFYKAYNYTFVSIALILSAGRAPPLAAIC